MGHEIDNTAGVYCYADSRDDAWHQLGQKFGRNMTPDEALEAAHMKNWNVRKVPLTAKLEHEVWGSVEVEVPDKFVVIRDNPQTLQADALGVVGKQWQPFQNEATTEFLYDLTDASGAHIETIAALRGGRETFVTMKMPTGISFTAPDGSTDATDMYIAVLNNHDGGGSLRAIVTPIRIVCANTQAIAEGMAKSTVALRHTGDPAAKMAEARALLGITSTLREVYTDEMVNLMVDRDEAWLRAVLNDVFGVKEAETELARNGRIERASQVVELMRTSPALTPWAGTAYAAYNAVTEWGDHFMPVTGKGDAATKRAMRTVASTDLRALKSRALTTIKDNLHKTTDQLLAV